MTLPGVLPAISDFIKGTISENLKKPLQPAGLFAAAIFLLLNLVFVFPPLAAQNNLFVTWYLGLDAGWQLVLALAAVIVLSYLLLSLGSTILKLATGESWADFPLLGLLFTKSQEGRLNSIPTYEQYIKKWREVEDALNEQQESKRIKELVQCWQDLWKKTTLFSAEQGYVAPTALGNTMNATASYIWQRYRIDMNTMLPFLQLAIKDEELANRIDDEKATLDFLLNMAFVLVGFSVWYVLLHVWLCFSRQVLWPEVGRQTILVPLVLVLLAYFGFYRAAVVKARAWGQAVQMAFELHRDKLRDMLLLREFKNRADERYVWKTASNWLIWGPDREIVKSAAEFPYKDKYVPDPKVEKEEYPKKLAEAKKEWKEHDEIFESPPPPPDPISLAFSDNVKVTVKATVTEEAPIIDGTPVDTNAPYEYVNYVVLVNNAATVKKADGSTRPAKAKGVYVLISDSRVLTIEEYQPDPNQPTETDRLPPPEVHGIAPAKVTGKRVLADKKDKQQYNQLWYIDALPASGTCVLRYRLRRKKYTFRAAINRVGLKVKAIVEVKKQRIFYTFHVTNPSQDTSVQDITLEVFDTRLKQAALEQALKDQKPDVEPFTGKVLDDPANHIRWHLDTLGPKKKVSLEYDV